MDGNRFDSLTRHLSSRRTALGAIIAGLLLPLEASARDKSQGKGKGKGKDKQRKRKGKEKKRAKAQEEPCWRAGACTLKKGANVSQCDLAGYTAPPSLNCTGCNISRANLRGANLSGATLTKANLSGSCLVDANLSGATIANNTNLHNAIFCNTTMPDGSLNNSGCQGGTACCDTCLPSTCAQTCCSGQCVNVQTSPDNCGRCGNACGDGRVCQNGACVCVPTTCPSLGKQCGSWPDGCGGILNCGTCGSDMICHDGACCDGCIDANGSCGDCRVFLTSTNITGKLGGLAGADQICQTLAQNASLPGSYKAWLSIDNSPNQSPASGRFRKIQRAYRGTDNTIIAANWDDLIDGDMPRTIFFNESGGPPITSHFIWTNTRANGTATGSLNCDGWRSESGADRGHTGSLSLRDAGWTDALGGSLPCNTSFDGGFGRRLYCFQQE